MSTVLKKGRPVQKPKMILAYNKTNGTHMSDQMTSYSMPLRNAVKWYKKLANKLILNTALVNSWVMYSENKNTKESIVQFKRQPVEYRVDSDNDETATAVERPSRLKHELLKKRDQSER